MAKKYQLVEADGLFGLVTDDELTIPDGSNLNVFMALLNEETGRLCSLRKEWSLGYGDSFVTKDKVPRFEDGYTFSGTTHYLGKRLSLEQFSAISQEDLDKTFEIFKERHPGMGSNYEHTWRGRLMKLAHDIVKVYENANKLSDVVDSLQFNMAEAQIPGTKMVTEHIALKTMVAVEQLGEKIAKKIEERENKAIPTQTARKPSLDSIITSSSVKATELRQQRARSAPAFEHTQSTPFDERSLF